MLEEEEKKMKVYYVNELDLQEEPSDSRDVGVVYSFLALQKIKELQQQIEDIREAIRGERKDFEIEENENS